MVLLYKQIDKGFIFVNDDNENRLIKNIKT